MDMNHLTIFVLEKLDVDTLNYSSWVYYFSHLCHGYGILDHLVDPVTSSSTTTPMDPPPKDAEWTKIDFIIRSWIFSTLAPSLRKRLVDLNPTTAKDTWTYIAGIFQDNKHPRATALKAELCNLKLGDLSIDGYFYKIKSIVLVLNGLGSPLSNDDVVTFALEGLPSTYETIFTVIVSREPILDLKMEVVSTVMYKLVLFISAALERFSTSKPKNFFDDFLLTTLGIMFKKPDRQAQV
nr:hybrid signal transduction histidine kinase M [Tanacetum cinerariifolium]